MTFRESHPFVLPDGRRFKTLICAAHSIVASEYRGCVIEERRIGAHTWTTQKISNAAARMAYETARREQISEDEESARRISEDDE